MAKDVDPEKFPDVDYETIQETQEEGLRWVSFVGEDPDGSGQYLNLFVRCVPRVGEQLKLLDGTWWKVTRIAHTVVRYPEWRCLGAMVYVFARRLQEQSGAVTQKQ